MWGSIGVLLVQRNMPHGPDAEEPHDFASFLQGIKIGHCTGSPSWRAPCRSCPAHRRRWKRRCSLTSPTSGFLLQSCITLG